MKHSSQADIEHFLAEFRRIVLSGRGLDLIPRAENNQALVDLGLTRKTCTEEILNLTPAHYCHGPEPDRDKPGAVWVFGTVIEGIEVYIKLKIAQVAGVEVAKCISFHPAERPLSYPLRKRKDGGR